MTATPTPTDLAAQAKRLAVQFARVIYDNASKDVQTSFDAYDQHHARMALHAAIDALAAAATREPSAVPEGWKLVPIEPTPAMSAAGFAVHDAEHDPAEVYCAMLAGAPHPSVQPDGWRDVLAERRRQVEFEGWTPEHDDRHIHGALAKAAACLAVHGTDARVIEDGEPRDWWGLCAKHGYGRRRLIIAGALIIAEIERIDRLSDGGILDGTNRTTDGTIGQP